MGTGSDLLSHGLDLHWAVPVTGTPHYPCAGHRSALIRFTSEFVMWLVATRWADMSGKWCRIVMASKKSWLTI